MSSNIFFFLLLLSFVSCQNEAPQQAEVPEPPSAMPMPVREPVAIRKINYPLDSTLTLNHLMGKFDPAKDTAFVEISTKYADREGLFLRKETLKAFKKMYFKAKTEGINLVIKSATRNFAYQKGIWERKWTGKRQLDEGINAAKKFKNPLPRALKILEYSSMPGTSRHHWGTDIDLNNFNNDYFEEGQGLIEYEWLVKNAPDFGFCQVYTEKGSARPDGYNEEKWHWSYLPIAKQLTELARREMTDEMVAGFAGAETSMEIGVVEKYVLGINQECF